MKKLFILCVTLLLLCTGCSKKIESVDANDDQLNAVIAAAETYLNSDEFKGYVDLFETTYGQDAKKPEVTVAFTFQHDDVEGFSYDLILFNIKADVAFDDHGEIVGFDSIQVIIDTKTGTAYDSLTYNDARNNFTGEIKTFEDGIVGFLNSGVLMNGGNDYLWSEHETSTRFTKDNIKMVYSHIDRIITAGIMPVDTVLKVEGGKELASDYFLERREMGCINIGGKGIVTVDGVDYEMNPRDGIYIGMGNKEVSFKCVDKAEPPKFYVSSCPAHATYPIVKIDITKAKKVPCGSVEDCNKRVINQYIHPEVIKSCQLAMGLTQLEPGSNWNTMPSHTHDRRMEVYMYLDMGENDAVFHMMGEPNETRHIIMHNEEAVISPSWSIHSGVGTKAYSFIWAMCGENQEFTDMDHIETKDLR